ncbi:DUF4402 domain-containing protein [Nemorincola caseinilytica]
MEIQVNRDSKMRCKTGNSKYAMRRPACYMAVLAVLLLASVRGMAQQPPPRPISVSFNPALGLRFGAFFQSPSGGTVTVSPTGVRTSTGGVILADLGYVYGAAHFDITANPGTLVSILNGPDATLTGSGSGSMSMHIGTSFPASPFVTSANPPAYNTITIGGTLTVGSPVANPSGAYSGSFYLTFVQE